MRKMARGGLMALVFVLSALPAHAANLPLFDPSFSIVPEVCRTCACGVGGALQFIQNIMNAAISLGVVFFLFFFVYAGFVFISSPTNPEAKSKARSMLANATIGFLITLAGWLIVDYLMKLVYDSNNTFFGPWNKILTVDDPSICIQEKPVAIIPGLPHGLDGIVNSVGQGSGATSGAANVCTDSNTPSKSCEIIGDSLAVGVASVISGCTVSAKVGAAAPAISQSVPSGSVDWAFISAGTNNPDANLKNELENIRNQVHAKRVVWLIPVNSQAAASAVRSVASAHGDQTVTYTPAAGDVHPTSYGPLAKSVTGALCTGGGGAGGIGVAKGLCADSNTNCSVDAMRNEGLNDAQARAMSCIAVTESGGDPNVRCSSTGACGLFQITATNWNQSRFHNPPCSSATSRNNGACNRQAAVLMFRVSGYQPWTGICNNRNGCGLVGYGQAWNANARACVQKYDPSARI